MDMDLNARSAKWKREQDKLKVRARRQQQTEALKRAAAEKARLELEKVQAAKRIERIQEQERLELLALEEQRVTGGIKYSATLTPVPTTGDGDKIVLPVSALELLNPQQAFDLGVFTFELSVVVDNTKNIGGTTNNIVRKTHAGVLEFVADEGTVGLPPKVAASLFVGGAAVPETIQVKYVRLEKGAFASLQPKGDGFGDRVIDFKKILERSLKAHTTLTVGDSLFVRHGKQTFEVSVAELKPESTVNILNTDLEVALLPSEAITRSKELEQRKLEAAKRKEELEQEKLRQKEEKLRSLEPEPPLEEKMQAKVQLRMPDGSQLTRRVAHGSPLRLVFELIEATTGDAARGFQLVATYPRRVFGVDASDKSMKELGLNGRHESLFVERVEPTAEGADEEQNVEMETESGVEATLQLPAQWQEAKRVLEQTLDEALNSTTTTPIHALEPIMPVQETADQLTKWQAQLQELENMGFTNRDLNVTVLERYQGRLLRVVNYLSELTAADHTESPQVVEPMQE